MTKNWYSDLPKYYQEQIKKKGLDRLTPNRRDFVKGAATVAGAMALSSLPKVGHAATKLNYMCWEGYNDPRIVEPFEKEHNAELTFDLIVDSAGGFAKLAAGAYRDFDVVSTDSPWIMRMAPAGICEYLDPKDFADVYETFYPQFAAPFEPLMHEGKTAGLPTRWGWVGPTLNTDYSKPEDWTSWDACFDKKNNGKIGVLDWGDWPILPMALHAGINPYKELDANELKEVRMVLRALFKNTRAIIGDLSVAQKGILDGSLVTLVGCGSYCTSALRKQGHKQILTIVPEPQHGLKQGIVWMEATAIVKDTDSPDLAKKLIKHVASDDACMVLSWTDFTCNVTPNSSVEAKYTAEQKDVLQVDYMWDAYNKSHFHDIAPNIDDMLAIWQEELSNAG
ncbi:MAG: extracellular solute-binding protein [Rhodospirillales bacterium]|nr:extracellular solute-binding protein [Rhodospirillales bacterium]